MKKITFTLIIFCVVGFVPHALAASNFVPLAGIPGLTQNVSATSAGLAEFFNNLYKYLIGLAAILAVIEIIWGGLEISTKDSVSKKSDGKQRIYNAILGLVLVLSPVVVFSIINPSILNLSLNLPALNAVTPASTSGSGSQSSGTCTGSSCGKSITVVYYAPKSSMACNMPGSSSCTFDPSTGNVIPRDAQTLSDFTSGCSVGVSVSQGATLAQKSTTSDDNCPTDAAGSGTSGSLMGYSNVCYNESVSCQANTTNQLVQKGCTISGASGILQIGNCLSSAAAEAWGAGCTWGILTKDTLGTGYEVSCQGNQAYVFTDTTGPFTLSTRINQLQPLISTPTNPSNGASTMRFVNICQSSGLGWKVCIKNINLISDSVPCPSSAQKNCYQKTLTCGSSLTTNYNMCDANPSWTPQ